MFVQLAKVENSAAFIAAVKSMGWDETNYTEVLDDLEGVEKNGFVINFDITKPKSKLGYVKLVTGVVFGTLGTEEGNRWFSLDDCQVYQDKDGNFWADEDKIEV